MTAQLFAQVLANVQSLGAKEDLLTGILATFFQISPKGSEAFFKAALEQSAADGKEYYTRFPEAYGVVLGEKVSKKRYAWIEDKRIAFAPDIWLFDQNAEEWSEIKPKPSETSFHFLIECKESARVTKGQARGYPFFEDDLFGKMQPRVFTLLIYDEASEEEKSSFVANLTWLRVSDLLQAIVKGLSEAPEARDLNFILELLQYHLTLNLKTLLDPSLRDDEAVLRLGSWIRSRVPCDGTIRPRTRSVKIGSRSFAGKWLCLNSDQKTQLWLYMERKAGVFHLQIEKWLDQAQVGKPTKIALSADIGGEQWNDLLVQIKREQQKYVEELS
ncbi:MAG: hypothetical protein H7318_00685 [Oligoflexus sp.]|nr:hypothetical protein [Oligoflexus sp.]